MNNVTKKIVFGSGKVVEMNVEEVITKFEGATVSFARRCVETLSWTKNGLEFEDYAQLGRMEIMDIFKIYDEKHCFSTIIGKRFDQHIIWQIKKGDAKKRNSTSYSLVSINAENEDGNTMEDIYGFEDENFTTSELSLDIQNVIKSLNKQEQQILNFMIKQDKIKFEFAKEIGLSRPTLNRKIDEIRLKLSNALTKIA